MASGRIEKTITFQQANAYALILLVPLTALIVAPFMLIHGVQGTMAALASLVTERSSTLWLALAFVIGIVVHELLHGFGWGILGGAGWKSISFGFKSISPYAHCNVPLTARGYRIGTLLPFVVLSVIPALVAAVTGSGWLLMFAWVMALGSSGDLLIVWLLHGVSPDTRVQDHPSLVGCEIIGGG
jgi:hypothetical protein